MAVFIELVTEPLEDRFQDYLKSHRGRDDKNRTTHAGRSIVRRPLRGLEVKEATYASIRVVTACGKDVELFDSSSYQGVSRRGYSNFLLQMVQDARMEKHQIIETFGEAYVFFFGESPRFLDCQALLINTHDFNWRAEWWANYDASFRGTRLAELGARLYLFYDDIIVEGYLISCQAQESADQPNSVKISFRMFVTNYSNVAFIEPPENAFYPVRSSSGVPLSLTINGDRSQVATVEALRSGDAAEVLLAGDDPYAALEFGSISEGIREYAQREGLPEGVAATTYGRVVQSLYKVPDVIDINASSDEAMVGAMSSRTDNIIYRTGNPLRSRIANNYDEFTGVFGQGEYAFHQNTESAMRSVIARKFDVDDLQQRTIYACSCYGADVDDPSILKSLGLSPGFGSAKKQASFAAYASDVASSGRSGGTAYSTSLGNGFGGKQDPLNSVYGRPEGDSKDLQSLHKFEEGRGDPTYGYRSPYSGGPGYGGAGFGDAGGPGHGSGAGSGGDPGFKNPALFTGSGIASAQSAYDKFVSPKHDSTSLTKGGSGVSTGSSGGVAVSVGGTPTAFALISVEGVLDPDGAALQAPAFSSLASLGTQCPSQTGVSYSVP